jgi:hypothetical protein
MDFDCPGILSDSGGRVFPEGISFGHRCAQTFPYEIFEQAGYVTEA